jgi:hypothetical protein
MKRIIHVNQHVIRSNTKNGTNNPPLTCKTYKDNVQGYRVKLTGNSEVIYSPDKPLGCGARVWIETDSEVLVCTDDGMQPL